VVTRDGSAVLALRWDATGPGGRLFPALDADLTLFRREHTTRLSLAGAYRPPLGAVGAGLDKAVLPKLAEAKVRSLLTRVADALGGPQEPARRAAGL
jgi:hypothetical protein